MDLNQRLDLIEASIYRLTDRLISLQQDDRRRTVHRIGGVRHERGETWRERELRRKARLENDYTDQGKRWADERREGARLGRFGLGRIGCPVGARLGRQRLVKNENLGHDWRWARADSEQESDQGRHRVGDLSDWDWPVAKTRDGRPVGARPGQQRLIEVYRPDRQRSVEVERHGWQRSVEVDRMGKQRRVEDEDSYLGRRGEEEVIISGLPYELKELFGLEENLSEEAKSTASTESSDMVEKEESLVIWDKYPDEEEVNSMIFDEDSLLEEKNQHLKLLMTSVESEPVKEIFMNEEKHEKSGDYEVTNVARLDNKYNGFTHRHEGSLLEIFLIRCNCRLILLELFFLNWKIKCAKTVRKRENKFERWKKVKFKIEEYLQKIYDLEDKVDFKRGGMMEIDSWLLLFLLVIIIIIRVGL